MKTKIAALAAGINLPSTGGSSGGGFFPLDKKQDSKCIDMDDKWNRYLAIAFFITGVLFIIMIVALAKVYIPNHEPAGSVVFDVGKSTRYLYYSYATYSSPNVTNWSCGYCGGPIGTFSISATCTANNSYAYIGYNNYPEEVVVAVRGPLDDTEWMKDLSDVRTPPKIVFPGYTDDYLVNERFFVDYRDLKQCIMDEVLNLVPQSHFPLVVVGHSYGGGLATMAALDIVHNTAIKAGVSLYTFGAPRVGNAEFARAVYNALGKKSQRMVNGGDCVARLPDRQFGYKHPPYEVWEYLENGNKYKICSSSGEDESCSISVGPTCVPHSWYMGLQCCNSPNN